MNILETFRTTIGAGDPKGWLELTAELKLPVSGCDPIDLANRITVLFQTPEALALAERGLNVGFAALSESDQAYLADILSTSDPKPITFGEIISPAFFMDWDEERRISPADLTASLDSGLWERPIVEPNGVTGIKELDTLIENARRFSEHKR